MKNKKGFLFLLFFLLIFLGFSTNEAKALVTKAFDYSGGSNNVLCMVSGNVTVNKTYYEPGEDIIVTAKVVQVTGSDCDPHDEYPNMPHMKAYINGNEVDLSGAVGQTITDTLEAPANRGYYNLYFKGHILSHKNGITVSEDPTQQFTIAVMPFVEPNPPAVGVTATPASISSGQSSTINWISSGADVCNSNGHGTGTSGNFSVNPTVMTSYPVTCTLNQTVIPGGCFGTYTGTPDYYCEGEVSGSNCGIPDGYSCAGWYTQPTCTAGGGMCHHGCQWASTPTGQAPCTGLTTQSACNAKPTCTWSPGTTFPAKSTTSSATVSMILDPSVSIYEPISGDDGEDGAYMIPFPSQPKEMTVLTQNMNGSVCTLTKNGVQQDASWFPTNNSFLKTFDIDEPNFVDSLNYLATCTKSGVGVPTQTQTDTDQANVLSPDLRVFSLSIPLSANKGVPVVLGATIKNFGNEDTGAAVSFSNFFQTSNKEDFSDPNANITDLLPFQVVNPLSAGGQANISMQNVFYNTGSYWIRVCADKENKNDLGVITEYGQVNGQSNENNNCSSATKITINDVATPDLVTSNLSPVTGIPGDISFTATVKNEGTAATNYQGVSTFVNLFQVTTSFDEAGNPINPQNYDTTLMSNINVNASLVASKIISINQGIYYVRACADRSVSNQNGVINEGSPFKENNNCSTWVMVTILPSAPYPELQVLNYDGMPTMVPAGDKVNLIATIKNDGDASTLNSFYNFFQVSTEDPNGGAGGLTKNLKNSFFANLFKRVLASTDPITDLSPVLMPTLNYKSTNTTIKEYVFPSNGIYFVRACADKSNRYTLPPGGILESNEGNNCGAWIAVTVGNATTPINGVCSAQHYGCETGTSINHDINENEDYWNWECQGSQNTNPVGATVYCSELKVPTYGNLEVSDCEILDGKNSCNVSLNWQIINPPTNSITKIITPVDITVASGHSGFAEYSILHGKRNFFLYNSSFEYGNEEAEAKCATDLFWNGKSCSDGIPNLVASYVGPKNVQIGQTVDLTGSVINSGTIATSGTFNNIFRLTTDESLITSSKVGYNVSSFFKKAFAQSGGVPGIEVIATDKKGPLGINQGISVIASKKITETTFVQFCTDQAFYGDPGTVVESNEDDNCSKWFTITVSEEPPPLPPHCSDGVDNDSDNLIDWNGKNDDGIDLDPDCNNDPNGVSESGTSSVLKKLKFWEW